MPEGKLKEVLKQMAGGGLGKIKKSLDKYASVKKQPYREDDDLNRMLDDLIKAGEGSAQKHWQMGRDALRYVYGDQNFARLKKNDQRQPVLNQIFETVIQEIALLSANNPTITAQPWEGTAPETAQRCGIAVRRNLIHNRMRMRIIQALLDDHIWGIKIAKTYVEPFAHWDEQQYEQTGYGWKHEIRTRIINPVNFGMDPNLTNAFDMQQDATFVWSRRWVDTKYALFRYPAYKKFLIANGRYDEAREVLLDKDGRAVGVPGGVYAGFAADSRFGGRESDNKRHDERELQARLADTLLGKFPATGTTSDGSKATDQTVLVEEFFVRDGTMEEVPAVLENIPHGESGTEHIFQNPNGAEWFDRNKPTAEGGFEPFSEQWPQREARPAAIRPKFPYGRLITRVDRSVVVQDQPWEMRRWPYSVAPGYLLPHTWHGLNCAEMVRPYQDYQNEMAGLIANYIDSYGNPRMIVEDGALSKDNKTNSRNQVILPRKPGATIKAAKGRKDDIKPMEPPSIPNEVLHFLQTMHDRQQDVSGMHDISQGRASTGEQTLGELQLLDRNSRQRVAFQGVTLDMWLTEIARNIVEFFATYNKPGDYLEYISDDVEDQEIAVMQWTESMKAARYDVQIKPTSTMPFDEERQTQKLMMANDVVMGGGVLSKEILENLKIGDVDEILQRHEVLGPLHQLIEMGKQMNIPHEVLMQALIEKIREVDMAMQSQAAAQKQQQQQEGPVRA